MLSCLSSRRVGKCSGRCDFTVVNVTRSRDLSEAGDAGAGGAAEAPAALSAAEVVAAERPVVRATMAAVHTHEMNDRSEQERTTVRPQLDCRSMKSRHTGKMDWRESRLLAAD